MSASTTRDQFGVRAGSGVQGIEHAADGVGQGAAGERDHLVGADVVDRGARPAQVGHPGGQHPGAPSGIRPAARSRAQHGQDPDRQLLGAVGGDLGEPVVHPRVGEPVEQCVAVGLDLGRRQVEMARRLGPPLLHPVPAGVVGDGLGDGLVPAGGAGVGQQRVRAVEQPELAVLVGLDVVGDRGAGAVPARAAGRGSRR